MHQVGLAARTRIMEIERVSIRLHCIENSFWKRLLTCHYTDYIMIPAGQVRGWELRRYLEELGHGLFYILPKKQQQKPQSRFVLKVGGLNSWSVAVVVFKFNVSSLSLRMNTCLWKFANILNFCAIILCRISIEICFILMQTFKSDP